MRALTVDLAATFGRAVRYTVPLYQRPYVWSRERQWEPLWADVRDVAERQLDGTPDNDLIPHFLGAIVLEPPLTDGGLIQVRTVIDGQQRLTTLQLLIAAARSIAAEQGLDAPRKMFTTMLFNEDYLVRQPGEEFKVLPTQRDRQAFVEAIGDGVVASSGSHRMHEAYRFFRSSILEWAGEGGDTADIAQRLAALSTAVWKRLVIVTIDLEHGDNAQVIFETLNARGTPLLAGDLVKNHLFQTAALQGAGIDDLYARLWRPLDGDWWREEVQQGRLRRPRLDTFLNRWLAMAGGTEVVSGELFPTFKRYLAGRHGSAAEVLADLARYAVVYEGFEREPRASELGRFFYRLDALEVTTAFPALLWLLGPEGIADPAERRVALGAIESWLMRRMLARQTTKNYNSVFLALLNSVRDAARQRGSAPLGADVADFLAGLSGESQAWPSDGQVRSSLATLPAYSVFPRSRLRVVLEALDQAMDTGLAEKVVLPTDLTIEHVLPQEWAANWPLPDVADPLQARLDRDAAKHRLGNLTLITGKLNSKESNGPWQEKREALRKYSLLRISADIRNAEAWDEAAIAKRTDDLTALALRTWPRPAAAGQIAETAGPGDGIAEPSRPAGPPDPDDPEAFASVLGIADEIGLGAELRRVVRSSREMGLHPRPDRLSVMVSPPADRRVNLFALWPQWDDGGSFRIVKSPAAFAKWIPDVSLEAAQAALGSSEEPGVLLAHDTEALLAAVRGLVPAGWAGDSFDERRAEILAMGIPNLDRAPGDVVRLIDNRAGGSPELALRFAGLALGHPGALLRAQQSRDAPWYFQVRHPRFSQVVVYAWPRPGEVRLEYRLAGTSDTYGIAAAREGNPYGVTLTAKDDAGLEVADRLLADALAAPAGALW